MITHKARYSTAEAQRLLADSCRRIPTVARYVLDVLTGNIPAGRMVFLAVERFLSDLEIGHKRGLRFDQGAAVAIIKFFRDHAFSTKPLLPYEQFIVANLFGWKNETGYRRFQEAYVEIGKGNRKTPLGAGLGIYGLVLDEEQSAEVYVVAPTKEQAAICFKDAATMRDNSPALKKIIRKFGCTNRYTSGNLSYGTSFMRPIAADRDNLDGPRSHMIIVDEEHELKDRQVVDKLKAGFKNRKQPLCFKPTNSGFDRESICWEDHEYSRKILEGVVDNDSHFAYVCQLDLCDECRDAGKEIPSCDNCDSWLDEDAWIKANPSLGEVLTKKYLQTQVKDALEKPGMRNLVQRLNFCYWTQTEQRFIAPDTWRACAWSTTDELKGNPEAWRDHQLARLRKKICFGGFDGGVVNDFTCLALYFPPQDGVDVGILLLWSWAPKEAPHHDILRERYGYDLWVRGRFLTQTLGKVTNYATVEADILELSNQFVIKEIAYDPARASELVQNLNAKGVTMVEHRQGGLSMTYPINEFHRSIIGGELQHGMNPVLTFMVDNLTVESDGKGNLTCHKPGNPNSPRKIDGAVAAIMARGRAAANPATTTVRSPFFV